MHKKHVLIAGVSTRAAAESAARAGFAVTSLDAFGDLDQHPGVHALSLPRDLQTRPAAPAAARAARTIVCDAAVYLSPFENHPRAVAALAANRALWGNTPGVLRRVRDPRVVAETLRRHGITTADVLPATIPSSGGNPRDGDGVAPDDRWLIKPLRSGGGHGVRMWRRGAKLPRGSYCQAFIDGTPGSVIFVAAGGVAVPIGVSRQIVGDPAFGAGGFRYCGSILAAVDDPQFAQGPELFAAASTLARTAASAFGLVGVNGVDFIVRGGVPVAIEINPRWSASMELVERAFGLSVFAAHAAACTAGILPAFTLASLRVGTAAHGKAIVFARHDVVVGDTRPWLDDPSVRDVPHPGEAIAAGRPVCTVLAAGPDSAACRERLVRRAAAIYAALDAWAVATASRRPSSAPA